MAPVACVASGAVRRRAWALALVLAPVLSGSCAPGAPQAPHALNVPNAAPVPLAPIVRGAQTVSPAESAEPAKDEEKTLFLSEFPLIATDAALDAAAKSVDDAAFAAGLSAVLTTSAPDAEFGEPSRRNPKVLVREGTLTLPDLTYPPSTELSTGDHVAASFVVDYDEEAFGALTARMNEEFPKTPAASDHVAFVNRYVEDKNYSRGFDIASQVAQTRAGDCTEHAVLLTASLRSAGIPSRIVMGLVIVGINGQLHAFGHAWSEYNDGTAWRLLDAALYLPAANEGQGGGTVGVPGLPPGTELRRAYLPLQVLRNEGPGFTLDILNNPLFSVRSVRVDAARSPAE